MTDWAYGVFLGLIFAALLIGVLEWARRDRKRVVLDAPVGSYKFTREEIEKAMAFPLDARKDPRELEAWEIDLINLFKSYELEVLDLIDAQFSTGGCNDRWLAIARTDLQKGFMALQRAVAKPPGDDLDTQKPATRTLRNVDIVHNDDGEVLAVKESDDPAQLAGGEPCLGAEICARGMTGDGEKLYD